MNDKTVDAGFAKRLVTACDQNRDVPGAVDFVHIPTQVIEEAGTNRGGYLALEMQPGEPLEMPASRTYSVGAFRGRSIQSLPVVG